MITAILKPADGLIGWVRWLGQFAKVMLDRLVRLSLVGWIGLGQVSC